MQRFKVVLAGCVCLGLAPIAGAVDGVGGVGGAAGGAVGGAISGAGGGAAGAAAAAARVRVPGRGAAGVPRPVGANFGPSRAGVSGGVGASASAPGIGVSGAAGVQARAELRGGAAAGSGPGDSAPRQSAGSENRPEGMHPQHNRLMLQADLMLARRLADIDRLRDVAVANGNEGLLLRADQLEQQARLQHDHRIAQVTAFPGGGAAAEGQIQAQARGEGQTAAGLQNRPFIHPETGLLTWFDAEQGTWMQAQAGPIRGAVEQVGRFDFGGQATAGEVPPGVEFAPFTGRPFGLLMMAEEQAQTGFGPATSGVEASAAGSANASATAASAPAAEASDPRGVDWDYVSGATAASAPAAEASRGEEAQRPEAETANRPRRQPPSRGESRR